MSDPFNSSGASNPYDADMRADWQYPGAPQPQRFITDTGAIIRMVLCCFLLGLAVFLLVRAAPNLKIALGGTTATGVVDTVQDCATGDNPLERISFVFLDRQGHEHFATTGCGDGYSVGDRVTVHYLAADPDGGMFTDGDIVGIILLVVFGGLSGLAGLILLALLLLRLKRIGIRRLSPATLITTLVLITLMTGTLSITRPGPPDKTSYRHYHIGEAVNVQGMWSVTVKSAQAQVGVGTLAPGKRCLIFDATFRNLTNQQQTPDGNGFSLSQANASGQSDYVSYCVLDIGSSNVAPGGTQEGQVGFIVPDSVHHFWLAYTPVGGEDARSVWDIRVASSTPSGTSYHHIGETVAVQGLWEVTIKSAHPAQIGLAPSFTGSTCLDIDVSMRNISNQILKLNHDDPGFQPYDTQGALLNFFPCPLTIRSLDGSVAPGDMAQGDFAFEVPASEQEVLLAFQPQVNCGYQCPAPTIWDIQKGAADTSGYHHIEDTVNVQSIWSVTITNPKLTLVGVQNPPKPGETCLFVQVSVKNSSSQQRDLSPAQFTLYDRDGAQLESLCGVATALVGMSLSPGDTAQGVIVFGVPTSDQQFRLAFQAQPNCEPDCAELDIWTIGIG